MRGWTGQCNKSDHRRNRLSASIEDSEMDSTLGLLVLRSRTVSVVWLSVTDSVLSITR